MLFPILCHFKSPARRIIGLGEMPVNTFTRRSVLAILVVSLACLSLAMVQGPTRQASARVLFVGNSYTYFNNLPEVFTRLAEAGHLRVSARMVAPGGWRLKDHWDKGDAPKVVREGKWDYVVLQDQSTLGVSYYVDGKVRVTSDEVFRPYAEKWTTLIRSVGARPVFYLTWARKATPEDQAALNYAYVHAAEESRALVAPVGLAWLDVRRRNPAIELFFDDGSHPSAAGTYLAACTFYAAIFDRSPIGLPARITGKPVNLDTEQVEENKTAALVDLPADQARVLQSAAWAAWEQLKRGGGYLDVSPVPAPTVAPLPAGQVLPASAIDGTWVGSLLFYPAGPAAMTLQLQHVGSTWTGRLALTFQSKDAAPESVDLVDLQVNDSGISFAHPQSPGVSNMKVSFRGVGIGQSELRGTAESTGKATDGPPVRLLGSWQLRKK
jgi:hypothetical protein